MWLVLALGFAACGGESETSGSDASSSDGTTGNSGISTTSNGDSTAATTSPNFGSPGPVTSGSSSSFGAGGNSSTSSDATASVSAGGTGGSGPGGAAGAGGAACEPQDVSGVGACDAAFGVFFLGTSCGWVSGCSCEGSDCENGYADEASCEAAHRECFDERCRAQDATFVGGCEPAGVYVYNGIECVIMDGCSCVGDDCDATYRTLDDCKAAHAVCEDRERSCAEIEAAYEDYVSHTACQDDSDCVMIWGACGVGLGGCYHTVNRRWDDAGIGALGDAWEAGNCGGGVCGCVTPPETVVCDDGVCAFLE